MDNYTARKILDGDGGWWLEVRADGEDAWRGVVALAWVLPCREPGAWILQSLGVEPECRGQGLGSDLLILVQQKCARLRLFPLPIETLWDKPGRSQAAPGALNQAQLQKWYQRYGFRPDPVEEGWLLWEAPPPQDAP